MTHTIIVGRDARDALYEQVQYDSEEADKIAFALQMGDRGIACRMLSRATYWRDLLDAIGWYKEDARDSYEIPAGRSLSDWLEAALEDMRKIVGDDRAMLVAYEQERTGRHAYIERSQDELIEKTTTLIDQEEHHARALLGVLNLLDDSGRGAGSMTSARSLRELSGAVGST